MFRSILFVEMNVSKLISYSMDMCWNGQGTTIYDSVKLVLVIKFPLDQLKQVPKSPQSSRASKFKLLPYLVGHVFFWMQMGCLWIAKHIDLHFFKKGANFVISLRLKFWQYSTSKNWTETIDLCENQNNWKYIALFEWPFRCPWNMVA